ncbi:MAG: endolytic transglycosylase MltG [Candidatus Brennerbacteria bacterium]|nr:endolytic transglycosylase MltG [Candidatus Brennerbacteria bacterium]
MGGFLKSRFIITLALAAFLIIAVAYFFWGLGPNAEAGSGRVSFKVSRGEGLKEIGAHLSQAGLVKSITVFKFYSLVSGSARKFQPGVHELEAAMSVPQIVGILTARGASEVTVTIPEGSTLKDVDSILSASGVIEEGTLAALSFEELKGDYEFLGGVSSLEGFLFPDTYRFEVDSGAPEAAMRMLSTFDEKVWPLLKNKRNWYDFLILASYLEREVPDFSDRRVVAGILLKRLSIGMPLQVDATISYLKCGGELRGCEEAPVLKRDLTLSSPYNTYQRLGWTPTPIANPGQAAARAAVEPQSSPYLYYLSAKTGETIFSRTLDEHNEARAKYL